MAFRAACGMGRSMIHPSGWWAGSRCAAIVTSLLLASAFGCGNAAAPPPDAEYPSLVFPARLPEAKPSGTGGTGATPAGGTNGAGAGGATGAPAGSASESGAQPAASGSAGERGPLEAQRLLGPHAALETSKPLLQGDLPDPVPLVQRAQWTYPVMYDKGTIHVGVPEGQCLPRPVTTARRIGRFAFELWLGRELVERVRFDFPLLGSEEPRSGPRRPLRETPRFGPGARVAIAVRMPASRRATSARVYDRATGESIAVAWPPAAPAGAAVSTCPEPPHAPAKAAPPAPGTKPNTAVTAPSPPGAGR